MLTVKFGGSSIQDADRISHVAEIVRSLLPEQPVVVFSAIGDTTDWLLEAGDAALDKQVSIEKIRDHHIAVCEELAVTHTALLPLFAELEDLLKGISLLQELSPKTRDYLLSFGERLSVRVIAPYFSSTGIPARAYDGWEAGLTTEGAYGDGLVAPESYDQIRDILGPELRTGSVTPIVTGFIGKNRAGHITTLGRGGSDLTASVIGAALDVKEIQVWKDVDGILTTDPRVVTAAQPVPAVSFEEASELAYFGAKVLHPLSIQPAMLKNIPVRVKNSYNPDHAGTVILERVETPPPLVKAITCKRRVTLIDIVSTRMLGQYGFLAKVFEIFNEEAVSVDVVATSEVSVSLTINNGAQLASVIEKLSVFAKVSIGKDKALLSVIGDVKRASEILDATFAILRSLDVNVQMISQGASKVNIGLIVEDSEVEQCVRDLHGYFFETEAVAA